MKKFLGILVAVLLCVTAVAPAVCAADLDLSALTGALEGVDLSNLSADEISDMLGIDVGQLDTVLSELENAGSGDGINSIISSLGIGGDTATGADTTAAPAADSAAGGLLDGIDMSAITDLFSGIDLSSLGDSVSSGDALSSITGMFEGIDTSSFDISALTDVISGAFGDSGLDLDSLTSGLDLGSFDISSILGGLGGSSDSGSTSGSTSDDSTTAAGADEGISGTLSGIADTLMGGLSSLGLDTSMLDGLMDNDIVNFFANLYMGIGKTDDAPETTKAPATTATPKTGDTSAVFVALGTLSIATATAFVCLKKKVED